MPLRLKILCAWLHACGLTGFQGGCPRETVQFSGEHLACSYLTERTSLSKVALALRSACSEFNVFC